MWRNLQVFWQFTSGAAPPPPPPEPAPGGGIHIGLVETILSSTSLTDEGAVFALPSARRNQISWQVILTDVNSATVVELHGSLDQVNFALLSVLNGHDFTTIITGVTSVKAILTDNPDQTLVTVRLRTVRQRL